MSQGVMMRRREFIRKSGLVSLGFLGLQSYANSFNAMLFDKANLKDWRSLGYGPLQEDPLNILNLPRGFTYKIISRHGDIMSDGFYVPGLADGMGTFKGKNGTTIIVRNHEVSPTDAIRGAFGKDMALLKRLNPNQLYDYGYGEKPCLGGTTTIVFNQKTQQVEREFLSLTGTVRNCAGGITAWNSWITCEESTIKAGRDLEKDHGYNFEVPASATIKLYDPIPLKEMGRFNHEAVCVDPRTSIVYQTEDRPDGLIYRYIPNTPGKLLKGGKLQILSIKGFRSFDTRNWTNTGAPRMKTGIKYKIKWLDIDEIESPMDDMRFRGWNKGAAVFARGEGMWFGQNDIYFACTNGGQKGHGQIFKYIPSLYEGRHEEWKKPGTLELFLESNNSDIVESCDNLTIASNGDLIICEDKKNPKILGVTPEGKIFQFAKNI